MIYRQILSYGLVGISNTLITIASIALLTAMRINLILANAIGFAIGLANSFLWNERFTFKAKGAPIPFLISFAIAYCLNLAALLLLEPLSHVSPLVPQAIGVGIYVVTFFVLMKIWVYR